VTARLARLAPSRPVSRRRWRGAPSIIGAGVHDFLYRDSLACATAPRAAGVPVTLREYATLNHRIFSFTAISPAVLAGGTRRGARPVRGPEGGAAALTPRARRTGLVDRLGPV